MIAKLTSRITATTSCWVWPPTMACAMDGPNSAPSTAPPTKPMKLSEPTMKPCWYPGDRERGGNNEQG